MLSRRLLRAFVMQSLYAYFQTKSEIIDNFEKALFDRIEKVYYLYIYQLSSILELIKFSVENMEEAKNKFLPSEAELSNDTKFSDNIFINVFTKNKFLKFKIEGYKINWAEDREIIRNIFNNIKASKEYGKFMKKEDHTFETYKKFYIKIFLEYFINNSTLQSLYEDKSIYWCDDFDMINFEIFKTLKNLKEGTEEDAVLQTLYNKTDTDLIKLDNDFVKCLLRKTIIHNEEYNYLISEYTRNWEIERVAMMDVLIMKMAICEITNVPNIPVKVSMNEYIEMAKTYSTRNSSNFINGVLDNIIKDLKKKKKIIKTGRGKINE